VNSGNANACTGRQGERDAMRMCTLAAQVAGCRAREILPSSTGIIGHPLPMEKVERGIVEAAQYLGRDREQSLLFEDAILTTDLKRKEAATQFMVGRRRVKLAGICKGSGMIGPRMATMLAYLTTDAQISAALLRKLMREAADVSFNSVTVDDHASTNDTACILASGLSEGRINTWGTTKSFGTALIEVCQSLAQQIAADGEGATKMVTIIVQKAASDRDARLIARAIAISPLVKCAMNGNDPNWGRIVSAAGLTAAKFDPNSAVLELQGTPVFRKGRPLPFDPEKVGAALRAKEVVVRLTCGLGKGEAKIWTCDLSKQYVSINADYHT